jgi:hypothetical protein
MSGYTWQEWWRTNGHKTPYQLLKWLSVYSNCARYGTMLNAWTHLILLLPKSNHKTISFTCIFVLILSQDSHYSDTWHCVTGIMEFGIWGSRISPLRGRVPFSQWRSLLPRKLESLFAAIWKPLDWKFLFTLCEKIYTFKYIFYLCHLQCNPFSLNVCLNAAKWMKRREIFF